MSNYYKYDSYDLSDIESNLVEIDGVGKTIASKLEKEGYEDLEDFEDVSPTVLYSQIDIMRMNTAISIVKQAEPDRFEPF